MIGRPFITSTTRFFLGCFFAAMPVVSCIAEEPSPQAGLIQFGGMHESVGTGQHQGRVNLAKIASRPHFYGVGALEALRGEITFFDSEAIVTAVTRDGRPQPMESSAAKATMLVGQSIEQWTNLTVPTEVSHEQFDKTLETMAIGQGVDISKPFIFVVEGEFKDVRIHILNGACPIHARMRKLDIEKENQPFELETDSVKGTLVGIFAADSVGKLTHPATRTHAHLIYLDEETGERVTGHIEQVGLAKHAILKFPAPSE